jgi:hypothetical protein
MAAQYQAGGDPVVSVDTKKKGGLKVEVQHLYLYGHEGVSTWKLVTDS